MTEARTGIKMDILQAKNQIGNVLAEINSMVGRLQLK